MSHVSTRLTAARTIVREQAKLPPRIASGEVRLKLATASLCGTDLHYYKDFANAGFKLDGPVTLGHEACGVVTDPNGSELAVGTLVALNPIIDCGRCAACRDGEINLCTAKRFPGSATTRPHLDGFFRDTFDFPARCCRPVDEQVHPDHLTFAEPLACAMHSVTAGGIERGSRVVITGCGPMGLLAVVAARARGAEVTVTDLREQAVELALSIGALDGHVGDAPALQDLSGSFDVAIEASGSLHAFNRALDLVRRKGTVSILSNLQRTAMPVDLHRIMLKELQVRGSFQFNVEFEQAVRLIESGDVDFERLVAARFALGDADQALELMLAGGAAGKILLKP